MLQQMPKYFDFLEKKLLNFSANKDIQIFIFGSSTKDGKFGDIDIGVMGDVSDKDIYRLKEYFEESNFPFLIDVVNFNKVEKTFKKNVLDNKVLWIKR